MMTNENGELKFVSLADSVFERFEDEILSGRFAKGEVFTESRLSEIFGVSRTPIREAIRRLEQENLIKNSKKGVEILGTDINDIHDIYEIRSRLEGLAAKKCAGIITEKDVEALREILDLQEFYISKNQSEKIKDTDSQFHEKIYSICGSNVYSTVLSSLHRRIKKYRKLSVQNRDRALCAANEHREILEALSKHDAEKAEKLTAKHIENAHKNIVKNFNE